MSVAAPRSLDTTLRALAFDALALRDGLHGWKPSRDAFLASLTRSPARLAEESATKLRAIVNHAYETTPYYRDLWMKAGLHPSNLTLPRDLESLPFLTKEIIKAQKEALISGSFARDDLKQSYTGGTTGTQTSFFLDRACALAREGRRWGIHELCGYRPGMRRALVWGVHADLPDPGITGGLKRRLRRYASSDETFCCTVMSERDMLEYYERLIRFRPQVLYGYPSALGHFGRFLEDRGFAGMRVETILTTAERLTSATRRQLQRQFSADVFNLYATREYGCIGFECSRHSGFHIDPGSVYLEIVGDGRVLAPGETGEIVVTDLLNRGMPFIRSRTGDLGALSATPCPCGSPFPLLKELDGRSTDYILRPDGSVVSGLMLPDLFADMAAIRSHQFVQQRGDRLDLRLVVSEAFSAKDREEVSRQVREIVGNTMEVRLVLVDELERNPRSGKLREVVGMPESGDRQEAPGDPVRAG